MSGEELFHYTNVDGLEGILREQNVRATHFRFLNDASELTYASEHLVKYFYEEIFEIVSGDPGRFGSLEDNLKVALARDEAQRLFKGSFTSLDEQSPIFVVSFCRHSLEETRMRGLLSQWRGYGADGGYAIVFDEAKFVELLNKLPFGPKFGVKAWKQVIYLEPGKSPDLADFSGIARSAFKHKFNRLCELGTIGIPLASRQLFELGSEEREIGELLEPIVSTLPFVKHKAFEEEAEFRVVVAALTRHLLPPEGEPPPFGFRKRGQVLVPYVNLFEGKVLAEALKRVIIGPGKNQDERAYGVLQLAASLKIEIEIELSDIPLTS